MKEKFPKLVVFWIVTTVFMVTVYGYALYQYLTYNEIHHMFSFTFKPLIRFVICVGCAYVLLSALIVLFGGITDEFTRGSIVVASIYVTLLLVGSYAYLYDKKDRLMMFVFVGGFVTLYILYALLRNIWNATGED